MWIAAVVALTASAAWTQDAGNPQTPTAPPDSQPQSGSAPAPAFGQDNGPAPVSENPPITALDQPGLEPHAAPLSYLQPALHVSEAVDSNVADTLGNSSIRSVSRILGSVILQRLWSNYALALEYEGGAGYYNAPGIGWRQVQQMDLDQKISWKRGQLGIRNSFSYMPEGNYGAAYGSTGGIGEILGGSAFGGGNGFQGGAQLGAVGQAPRIVDLALVDVVENLTPKSSVTLAGGYGFAHFLGNDVGTAGISYLGNTEASVELAYDRILGPHDQAALVYGYQAFNFSVSQLAFHSNVVQLLWGHRISGRMDFLIGAGPQFTHIFEVVPECSAPFLPVADCVADGSTLTYLATPTSRITAAGRASLRYKFPRTYVSLGYYRYNTSGSGLFAGSLSDVASLSATRPLGRVWSAFADMGYAHNSRLQDSTSGAPANTYDYGFAGVGVHRMLTRTLHAFVSYQFNEISFDQSFCSSVAPGTACSRIGQRHVGAVGIDWTPRPMRLD
jgi:hypothetical protein